MPDLPPEVLANEMAKFESELARVSKRLADVEASQMTGAVPVEIVLSPETTRRIAQAVEEMGVSIGGAAMMRVSESAKAVADPLTELLTGLVAEETRRVLMEMPGAPAGAVPPAEPAASAAEPVASPSPAEPAPPASETAPPAAPVSTNDLAGPEPLTLDSLDDPFLEALIQREPLLRS